MAEIGKTKPNQVYLSKRLISKLKLIYEYPLSIIEAPDGYGKTTSVKEFLKSSDAEVVWFQIEEDEQKLVFHHFCKRILSYNSKVSENISKIGYPVTEDAARKIAGELLQIRIPSQLVLVFDNFQYITDRFLFQILMDITAKPDSGYRVILLTDRMNDTDIFQMTLKKQLNHIGISDLSLKKNEIVSYFQLCGVRLSDEEAEYLYVNTEGWIGALYLQLVGYLNKQRFGTNEYLLQLVQQTFWRKLSNQEKNCLLAFYPYQQISRELISFLGVRDIHLFEQNGFVQFHLKRQYYQFHPLLKGFLNVEFKKLDSGEQYDIMQKAGDWYALNTDYYEAILLYFKIRDYASIYTCDYKTAAFLHRFTAADMKMVAEIISSTPEQIRKNGIRVSILLAYLQLLFGDFPHFNQTCSLIKNDLMNSEQSLEGDFAILYSLSKYSTLDRMNKDYKGACRLLKGPSDLFSQDEVWAFCCPSVLSLFHRESGKLESEIRQHDEWKDYFEYITAGCCKGQGTLMRAEALYHQGETQDAKILCNKAIYQAESDRWNPVMVTSFLLLCRIAIQEEDYDGFQTAWLHIQKVEKGVVLDKMVELCNGFLGTLLENRENTPVIFTNPEEIGNRFGIYSISYANLIYSKILMMNGEYEKLLGVSGKLLEDAKRYSNVMVQIHLYIYVAVANNKLNRSKKALKILKIAIQLAAPDHIIAPFSENEEYISNLLEELAVDESEYDFVITIRRQSEKWNSGLKIIKSKLFESQYKGLTVREYEVARLAAGRLSNKEIARTLFLAESTVKSYLKIIFQKLSIRSRSQLKDFF